MAELRGNIRNVTQKLTGHIDGIRGAKGDKGDTGEQGVSIVSTRLNPDYTLTITLSDGASYTSPSIRGEKGDTGEQGVKGDKGDKGDKGEQGLQGAQGIQGVQGIQGEKGEKGDKGDKGEQGIQGIQGEPGDDYVLTASDKTEIAGLVQDVFVVTVTGQNPVIVAESNHRYMCSEVLSLDFTPCASGICEVIFTSGSSVTVLTLPETIKMPEWFEVETNHTYEISVVDGVYGAVMVW